MYSGCLDKIAAGNEQAYNWLYKNYSRRIFDHAFLLTLDAALSEDIVQEVFLKLWIYRLRLVEVENFNAYFYQMARNCIIDKKRQRHTEQIHLDEFKKNINTTIYTDDWHAFRETELVLHHAVKG